MEPFKIFFPGDVCWIGHHCPVGTASPLPCSPGTYMNRTQAAECYTCPPGYYCINRVYPEPCPAGNNPPPPSPLKVSKK